MLKFFIIRPLDNWQLGEEGGIIPTILGYERKQIIFIL